MIAWTIAGSDSGGGAGIQADLTTFHALGVHGCSVVTALTAQNTRAVTRVETASLPMIEAQFDALNTDLPPRAVKTGMLGNSEIIALIAEKLKELDCFYVCDPVMVATSGGTLMAPDAKDALIQKLLPRVDLLTPNLPEAEVITGMSIGNEADMMEAAKRILALGPASVLMKGGHGRDAFSQDYWTDGEDSFWLTTPRRETKHTHGSGCTLSAALAACMALGYPIKEALIIAKAYIAQGIRQGGKVGGGHGPVWRGNWPSDPADMPWLTKTAEAARLRPTFPDCGSKPLGFYPIVDRSAWLERLLPLGVGTVQLRIKDLEGPALEQEIAEAVRLAANAGTRLFVNDYWKLAIRYGAYGVHLGQSDLNDSDPPAIAEAGLRLGISTHSYEELARALSLNPSYIALGPVYPTTTKEMPWEPQGLARVRLWRDSITQPLVAIGGIKLDRAPGVIAAGADSLAVITAITEAADPLAETRKWLSLFPQ